MVCAVGRRCRKIVLSVARNLVAFCLTALFISNPTKSAAAQQGVVVPEPEQTPYTIHVTKREVLVDVIALDSHDRPLLDLAPSDLNVFDKVDQSRGVPKAVSNLRIVEPSSTSAPPDLPQTDFLGLVHGSCMLTYTAHYQLAYDPGPDGLVPGIHSIQIQSKRRGIKLFYRHGYLIVPPSEPEGALHKAATPPTIVATARESNEPVSPRFQTDSATGLAAQRALDYAGNSFGSTVPSAVSLCADVYEVPEKTERLPDFRRLSPIGIVYTDFLSVSRETDVIGMGLPDITTRGEWVGLDYYGRIWITHPGTYHFQMISDDGALLEIDGKRVIDLDGIHAGKTGSGDIALVAGEHAVHIPYFQGPRAAVLMLWVEAPGEVPTLFDTRNFVPPPAMPGGR